MPSASPVIPKLKRRAPEFTSVPTRPSSRPSTTIATAFSSDPRARTTAAIKPQTISEKFRRAELQRDARERRRRKRNQQRRDATGEEGTERGNAQRRSGATLTRHLVAVDGGDDRRCLAGDVD